MAIVNVSLDTATRQAVFTVNGVLVPGIGEFNISQYKQYDTGEIEISFGYTVESVNSDGLTERRHFYLPSAEEIARDVHSGLNDDGFASKVLHDDKKAQADVIDYLQRRRNSD